MHNLYRGTPFARPDRPEQRLAAGSAYAAEAFAAFVTGNPQVITVGKRGTRKGKPEVRRMPFAQTQRGLPPVSTGLSPWQHMALDALTGSAAGFAAAAQAAGYEVAARRAGASVQVGVRHADRNSLWMRATWTKGATKGVQIDGKRLGVTEAKALLAKAG